MKPLNRPMFRYGGPIKEGVMSGIREPKKNGGSMMANDEGPRRAALVGNPIYPKGPDGRTNHVLPFIIGQGLRMAARPFGQFVMKRAIPYASRVKYRPSSMGSGPGGFERGKTLLKRGQVFEPNKFGQAFINDPLAKSVMTGSSFVGKGIKAGGKGIYNVGKYATTTPSGLAFLGLPVTYQAGKYFLPDGKEITGNDKNKITQGRVGTSGAPGGGDPGMYLEPQTKKGGGVELTPEQLRAKNVERYRDIMDIKGMNKDAAYNSLIAASQAINESGDFKGDIKSGKLINQIIQATSKQFDKPKATKDAIDTLILKGEIEKDINASDPKSIADLAYKEAATKKLKKELNPSFNTLKAGFAKDNKGQSGIDLAAGTYAANNGIDFKGNIISKSEFNDILKDLKAKTKGLDEDLIIKNYTEEIIKTQEAPDGAYTVGDKIVIIQDKQVIAVE